MAVKQWIGGLLAALAALSAQAGIPIQHWTLDNGARVYFVESRGLPMLDVNVDFAAGSAHDARDKAGTAHLVRQLLSLGAGGLSEDEISRRYADVGAQPGGSFDRDRAGVGVRTLSSPREREQALDTLARVLQQPDFPEAILQREKARLAAALKEEETRPETIADKAFNLAIYGEHPYGVPATGEIATLEKITRADLLDFHRRHYVSGRAVVALIGDLSREEADAIARRLTAKLPREGSGVLPAPVSLAIKGETRRIPHPASQSHILVGMPGLKRGDPDYFPLLVGNYILGGGGFASRLLEEIREKRGLAYSAYSYFLPLRDYGPFQVGLQTKKEQADLALSVVRETLKAFIDKGPTDRELKKAKDNLILGFPLRIDSNRKILDNLAVIGFYGLPLDWLDQFTRRVSEVTVQDIQRAFSRRLNLDVMATVIVAAPGAGEK
jgi:zinc protease